MTNRARIALALTVVSCAVAPANLAPAAASPSRASEKPAHCASFVLSHRFRATHVIVYGEIRCQFVRRVARGVAARDLDRPGRPRLYGWFCQQVSDREIGCQPREDYKRGDPYFQFDLGER